MPLTRRLRPGLLALTLGAAVPAPLPAQTALVVEYNGKAAPVVAASVDRAVVEDHGKPTVVYGDRFALVKVKEYLPVFIAVRNVRVRTSRAQTVSGGTINNEFHFHGNFSSAYPLKDVFAVFEMHSENGSKNLFLYELGRMEPNDSREINLVVPVGFPVGSGHYRLHLYSQGMEVLNSQQPFTLREAALDRIVADRLKGRKDGPPEPFIGPPPEYPSKLGKSDAKGQAVIRLRILPNGAVVDPQVIRTTDPLFGEAAVDALRQWRFYPEIKGGRPVATTAQMPVDFAPPQKS